MVIRTLSQNTETAQQIILSLIDLLDHEPTCDCGSALSKALITNPAAIPAETREKLALLIDKYFPS
jgi:5'-methylthioadenosine phosphorylase